MAGSICPGTKLGNTGAAATELSGPATVDLLLLLLDGMALADCTAARFFIVVAVVARLASEVTDGSSADGDAGEVDDLVGVAASLSAGLKPVEDDETSLTGFSPVHPSIPPKIANPIHAIERVGHVGHGRDRARLEDAAIHE